MATFNSPFPQLLLIPITFSFTHLPFHIIHSPNLPPQPSYPSNSSPISNQRIFPVILGIRFLTSLWSCHRCRPVIRYSRGWARRGGFQGFSVVDSYRYNGAVGTLTEALREPSSMPKMDCVFDRCDIHFKKQRKKIIDGSENAKPPLSGGEVERAARYQKMLHIYSSQQGLASKISAVLDHVDGYFQQLCL